ncbi:hypothetical protein COM32_28440 [Bacillus pseudomycoides]|uniref:sunset domain-containing protein n=1 Tax=Bacillus pseudomycoides TaxID=64104 RepID=UPI000BF87DFB|nr:hypothetical protein [Bacillus pseudomycoides]PGD14356.1 hypothetical protein COM32_28440 [Bacillus pseudomycoides]
MSEVGNKKEDKKRRGCGCLGCLGIIILLIILLASCFNGDKDTTKKEDTKVKETATTKQEDERKQEELKKQQEEEQKKQQELKKQQEEEQKKQQEQQAQVKQEAATPAPQSNQKQSTEQGGSCNIKGNKNSKGEKIYHMPGQQFYDKTNAEEMFCSEAEAKAAGYRASKR